jgi:predicted ABC-type ATPase
MPELHVVAGPNGIGKTTIFKDLVPKGLEYLNADLIAKTIREKASGRNAQDIANQEAGKIFYQKANMQESFAIETNLWDVDTYKSFQDLQNKGYQIYIYFLSTDNVNICLERVNLRVKQGGHFVHPEVIQQRYTTGLALLKHYKNFPDVLVPPLKG